MLLPTDSIFSDYSFWRWAVTNNMVDYPANKASREVYSYGLEKHLMIEVSQVKTYHIKEKHFGLIFEMLYPGFDFLVYDPAVWWDLMFTENPTLKASSQILSKNGSAECLCFIKDVKILSQEAEEELINLKLLHA